MNIKFYFLLLLLAPLVKTHAQELEVYYVHMIEGEQAGHNSGFVSLSDNYPVGEADTLAMPDVSELSYEEAERIVLQGQYRSRLLNTLKLSEKDNIFVYNYANNILVTIPIKEVMVVAWLNIYASPDYAPFRRDDYMIGFEIPVSRLKGIKDNTGNTFVAVGKNNPFEQGKMKHMMWQPVAKKDYPVVPVSAENIKWLEETGYGVDLSKTGDFYTSETEGYIFFVQHYMYEDGNTQARRLLVLDAKTKKPVTERFFFNSEGSMLVPLGTDETSEQFVGRLFKSKAPVTLGFEYASFSCESITVISEKREDIDINCDNRH